MRLKTVRKETQKYMGTDSGQQRKYERMIFDLRSLYADYGYSQFRIRKFEEYELYVRNKDFLDSVNIITFTDTNGKLMALKPDVTLSIVKNSRDVPGTVQKVYYNENIYRVSHRSHMFEELMQVGLECIGDLDYYCFYEVLMLAVKTLQHISEDSILVVSDMDILAAILNGYGVPEDVREDLVRCLGEKNTHTLRRICEENGIDESCAGLLSGMAMIYGRPERVLPELMEMIRRESGDPAVISGAKQAIDNLQEILETFDDSVLKELLRVDFSVVSDVNYYNGIVFNGFVEGIPECVISGGQYDRLMQKMKRKSRAIGFGVYMDRLERYLAEEKEYDVDVLLLYEKETDISVVKKAVEDLVEQGNTVLAQRSAPEKTRFRRVMEIKDGEVRSNG